MATYTKETALYDTGKIGTDIANAGAQVNKYITTIGDTGIKVHPYNSTQGQVVTDDYTKIDSHGLDVVVNNDSVASFLDTGITLGDSTEAHALVDYHSLQLFDQENDRYLHISDLRGTDGYANIVETFEGDGNNTVFEVNLTVISVTDVKIDDVITTAYSRSANRIFTFTTAPAYGAVIKIAYKTNSSDAKAYSLGERKASGDVGPYSVAMGKSNIASGINSIATGAQTEAIGNLSTTEGYHTIASGYASHAEGVQTESYGSHSHAEGYKSIAGGDYSHAQNLGTLAHAKYQTVLGKYNDPNDGNSTPDLFAVQIGNGTASDSRSNALSVAWTGDVNIASGARYKVNNVVMPVIAFEDFTQNSVSVSSSGSATATINVAKTGYTPMGIIRIQKSGTGFADIAINRFEIDGNNALIGLTNVKSTARTINLAIRVLYVMA